MKALNLFLVTFLLYSQVISQNINYKITYRHNLQFDTLKSLTDTIGLEAILIGNINESNYSFAKAPRTITPLKNNNEKSFQEIVDEKKSGTTVIKTGLKYDSIGNVLYYNKKNNIISVREKMKDEYILTEETAPIINWTITDEIKMIKTYTCKKATTHFRGRDYIAWFTTDIPIVAGPWKFNGLPGLVIDIEDTRRQVKLYIEKIEYPVKDEIPGFVSVGTKLSLEKYFVFRNEEFKKHMQSMQVVLDKQDGMQDILNQGGARPTVKSKSTLFNIELRMD